MSRLLFVLVVAAVVFSGACLQACSVPVFRYAVEQWAPDNFRLIVFHRGKLSETDQALVNRIDPKELTADHVANVSVVTVDLDQTTDSNWTGLWEKYPSETLPWMFVLPPESYGMPMVVTAGEFNAASVDRLLSSPTRDELTLRLLRGEAVVWVLLESGNVEEDDAAAAILATEIARLENTIALPEIEEADIEAGLLSIDPEQLKLKFSMIRVSREDPLEESFVEMLLTTEPDLRDAELSSQPMALPVFGRARSLYALTGKGINPEMIEEASRFLVGACQCTVKAENPGVDLLTSVDWERLVVSTIKEDTSVPELTGLGAFAEGPEKGDGETVIDSAPKETSLVNASSDEAESVVPMAEFASSTSYETRSSFPVSFLAILVLGGIAIAVAMLSLLFVQKSS